MPDGFVPLNSYLRPTTPQPPETEVEIEIDASAKESVPDELRDALREARRFRAAIADSLDAARDDVLRDFATDVLARELRLSPADVECVAKRAIERLCEERPLTLRVHPDDAPAVQALGIAVAPDATLRRGDVILELHYGTIDLTLGTRLSAALDSSRSR